MSFSWVELLLPSKDGAGDHMVISMGLVITWSLIVSLVILLSGKLRNEQAQNNLLDCGSSN